MKKFMRFIPSFLYLSLIWFLSSKPALVNIGGFDKTVHFLEYGFLGFLLSYGFELKQNTFLKIAFYCISLGFLAGVVDELHQYFVPERSCDVFDALADLAGSTIGVVCYFVMFLLLSYVNNRNTGEAQE